MGTMLEAIHTCNSQDKNSSNAPLSTHRSYLVPPMVLLVLPIWVSPGYSPSLSCWEMLSKHNASLSTMQVLARTHPDCASVQQRRQPMSHKASPARLCTLLSPAMPWGTEDCTCYVHEAAEGLTACPWEQQLLLSLLSQLRVIILFLPPPLPNTCRHHRENGANPARGPQHLLTSPCCGGTSGATPAFLGNLFKFTLRGTC